MTPAEQQAMLAAMLGGVGLGGASQGMFDQLYPTVDKKVGDTNYYQDQIQMLMDPMSGALSGGLTPGAFDSTFERTYVEAPGAQLRRMWSTGPEASATRVIHDLMFPTGGAAPLDAGSAVAAVQQMVAADPEGPTARSLTGLGERDYQTGERIPGSEIDSLYKQATELQASLASDPSTAGMQYDDAAGQYYTEEETKSEIAQQFEDAGLPNPFQEYTTDDFTYQGRGADIAAQEAGLYAEEDAQTAALRRLLAANRGAERPPFTDYELPGQPERVRAEPGVPNAPIEYYSDGTQSKDIPTGMFTPADGALYYGKYDDNGEERFAPIPTSTRPSSPEAQVLSQLEGNEMEGDYSRGDGADFWGRTAWNAVMPPELSVDRPYDGNVDGRAGTDKAPLWGAASDRHPRQGVNQPGQGTMMADYFKGHADDSRRRQQQDAMRRWQEQSNQSTRDRRKTRMANNDYQADNAAAQAQMIARLTGRTPFNDVVQQRMLGQQIAGF